MFTDSIKQRTLGFWIASGLAALGFIIGLAGVITYLVNSTTGHLANQGANPWISLLSFLALILAAGMIAAGLFGKFRKYADVALIIAVVFLGIAIALFILDREILFVKVWLNPDNDHPAEISASNVALAGIILYFISIVTMIAASFFNKFTKEKPAA